MRLPVFVAVVVLLATTGSGVGHAQPVVGQPSLTATPVNETATPEPTGTATPVNESG